jgi:peptidoglycan hydrolase CwlO-like protein
MPESDTQPKLCLTSDQQQWGESLVRIHHEVERIREDEARRETRFTEWQQQWSKRKQEIARRLEMIEEQMEQMSGETRSPQPRLAIFGAPADGTET